MKTLFSALAIVVMVLAANATSAFAQCDDQTKERLYAEFLANYRGADVETRGKALTAGQRFLEICKEDPDSKEIVTFLEREVPRLDKWIKDRTLIGAFDAAGRTRNYADALRYGKEIYDGNVVGEAAKFNLALYLTVAAARIDGPSATQVQAGLEMGRASLGFLREGKTSPEWGLFDAIFKDGDNAESSRQRAIGAMNFNIGWLLFWNGQKMASFDYLLEALKAPNYSKAPDVHQLFGEWYLEEAKRFEAEAKKNYEDNGNVETEEALLLFRRGLAAYDKAIAEFAYAERNAKQSGTEFGTALAAELLVQMKGIYEYRFEKAEGFDEFVAEALKRPIGDPRAPIEPVEEEDEDEEV
jgi:tetratricopeptide (TPR) repeat protein